MAAGDATYATQADMEAYSEGWVTDNPDALKRLLQRAERDIDLAVGNWTIETNGLKFGTPKTANEKHLRPEQVAALARATCAQAEYRFTMGEEFFRRPQHTKVKGPDFEVEGQLPWLSPKARRELEDGCLYALAGRARAGSLPYTRRDYQRFLAATRHDGT